MRESTKGDKGDHRVVSDPIKERKDFIEHLKNNAPIPEDKDQVSPKDTGPLNENELKGSRQRHNREHYGSVQKNSSVKGPAET